ncbi:hypothetical protein HOY82DRAFT_609945 [Tuber indicum]|nr:hypothetical protein HOY82DRAFT_609945 [Tuber indicum]
MSSVVSSPPAILQTLSPHSESLPYDLEKAEVPTSERVDESELNPDLLFLPNLLYEGNVKIHRPHPRYGDVQSRSMESWLFLMILSIGNAYVVPRSTRSPMAPEIPYHTWLDPNQPDGVGQTPLAWAAKYGPDVGVKQLLARGDVNPDTIETGGRKPLPLAAENWCDGVVMLLLSRDDVNLACEAILAAYRSGRVPRMGMVE